VSARLAGVDIHADDPVFPGHAFLRCPSKAIEALLYNDVVEAEMPEQRDKLCLRQSAGDSTGPQIHISANRLRQLGRDDNVSVQELSAGLENPEDLTEGLFLVRDSARRSR
jgi:hypothetical protein